MPSRSMLSWRPAACKAASFAKASAAPAGQLQAWLARGRLQIVYSILLAQQQQQQQQQGQR